MEMQSGQTGIASLLGSRSQQEYKSDDPIRQGFFDSTFFKPNARSTMDVVNYTYQGNPMGGSSSQIGQFGNYLDSIGKGDLLQSQDIHQKQQIGPGSLLPGFEGINNLSEVSSASGGGSGNVANVTKFDNQLNVTPPEIPISMQTPMSGFEGINNFSEFGKAPSFGVNSFGNTMGENNSFKNAFTDLQLNQQPFNDNQGLSSYVDNLVNGRLKNIFGGIMSAFK